MPSLSSIRRLARTLDPRRSLRARIALSFAALTLVSVVAGSAMEVRRERQRLEAAAGRALADYAETMADQLGRDVDHGLTELRVMAPLPLVRDRAWYAAESRRVSARGNMFTNLSENRPAFAWIALADADGRIVAASRGHRLGEDVGGEPWFAAARKGPYVGGEAHPAPALEKLLGGSSVAPMRFVDIALPVVADDGGNGGVLVMHLPLSWARAVRQRLIAGSDRPAGAELFVLDRAGNVVLGAEGSEGNRLDLPWLPKPEPGEGAYASGAWPDGKTYLAGTAVEDQLGWRVVARQDPVAAFASVAASYSRTALQAVLLAIICGLLGWWLAGRIAAPLRAITRAARRIRQGERAEIPLAPHDDEIAELSLTLRETMHGLEAQRHELAAQLAERERVQKQLVESEERLARALEGATLALWDADIERGTLYLSESWARMLGERPAPAVTSVEEIYERVHPDDRARMRQSARDVIKGVIAEYHEEYRIRSATGQWVWVQSRGKVVERDERGRALRMTGTNADVTQRRKQAEEALLRPRHPRRADRAAQPPLLHDRIEQAIARGAAQSPGARPAVHRPRPLQDGQRFARPPRGRPRCCMAVGERLTPCTRELRHDRPPRRRRVRRAAGRSAASAEDARHVAQKVLDALSQRPFESTGMNSRSPASIGICAFPDRRRGRRDADAQRRHRDVPREADAAATISQFFTPGDERRGAASGCCWRTTCAMRAGARRVHAALPAAARPHDRRGIVGRRGAGALAPPAARRWSRAARVHSRRPRKPA